MYKTTYNICITVKQFNMFMINSTKQVEYVVRSLKIFAMVRMYKDHTLKE